MTLSSGTKLSRYEIRSKLGEGGMGEVYLARDTSESDRTVAIKLLPAEVAADPTRMQRFIQEARTVSALNHPNVLTIYEFGQEGETRFIATECVEGVTVREHMRVHRVKLHEVLDIAMQVAATLDAAHEAHVVHRDIKPDNVMVRRRDHIVKVLDFGLAKPVETLRFRVDTEAGTRLKVNTELMESAVRPTVVDKAQTTATTLHQRNVVIAVAALLIIAAGTGLYFYLMRSRSGVINTVAVLPFVNASGNGELEYLSDGLTESLITSLSQLPNLSVKARDSVFRYKGKDAPPLQLGKDLDVQAIVNGRVVQRGNDLTLHIELVDVNTETALWSGDYNRSMTDLVSLPSEIARDVSIKLRLKLSGADEQKLAKNYTANTEAYQLYLKGRFHVFKLSPLEVKTGISYFQQAIQLDPNYALAYVGLSEANRSLALGVEINPAEVLPKAKAAAQKALEIDDDLAEAHTALGGSMFWYDWNWNDVEDQYKRALLLNPNIAESHLFYAHLLSNTGRHREALVEIERARVLDPYSPFLNALEGQFLNYAGKSDEALVRLHETFELAPSFWFPHIFASGVYIDTGRFAEAIAEAHRAKELQGVQTISVAYEGYALAKLGKQAEARALVDELLKLSAQRFVPPYHIAILYNGLGERDQALNWLERGFEERDPKMTFLKVDTKWNNLRGDPRFQDLMRRMGFPQ